MIKRILKRLVRFISLICLILTGGITWLVATESGLAWLANNAEVWIPGELKFEQVQGRLIDNFQIKKFSYQYEELAIQFDSLQLAWLPKALITNLTVHLQQFHLTDLKLHLPATKETPPRDAPPTLPNIQLPVSIILESVQVQKVSVQVAEKTPIRIDSIDLVTTTREHIALEHFSVQSPQFQVTLAGHLAFRPPYPLQLDLSWSAQLPEQLSIAGEGTLTGDIKHLVLTHTFKQPTTLQAEVVVDNALEDLHWGAHLNWATLSWPLKGQPLIIKSQQAKAQLKGTLRHYQIALQTNLSGPHIPPSQWKIVAQGDRQALTIESLRAKLLDGHVKASGQVTWHPTLRAQLNLSAEALTLKPYWSAWPASLTLATQLKASFANQMLKIDRWQVNIPEIGTETLLQGKANTSQIGVAINWRNLQWPLSTSSPLLKVTQGNATVNGSLRDYQIKLATQLTGRDVPTGQWQALGRGDLTSFQLTQLQGKLLQGQVALAGQVNWQPAVAWQLRLNGQGLNPGQKWEAWPGKLAVSIHSQGKLVPEGIQTQINVEEIQGTLRDYPLKLQTQLAFDQSNFSIQNAQLTSGDAHVNLSGTLLPQAQLKWTVNVPNLSHLLPQGQGQLQAQGQFTGALSAPHLIMDLEGQALGFEANRLGQITAHIDANLAAEQEALAVEVRANDFTQGTQQIDKLQLHIQGQLAQHTLETYITSLENTLKLQLTGRVDQDQWRGQLNQLAVDTADFGHWQLIQPAHLVLSAQQVQLDYPCLRRQTAKICTQIQWQNQAERHLAVTVEALPLTTFKAFLSPDLAIVGNLNGTVSADLQADGTLRSNLNVNLSEGQLQGHFSDTPLSYQGGTLQLQVTEQGLAGDVNLKLLGHSDIQGHITLPKLTQLPVTTPQPLTGRLQIHFADSSLLPLFVPQIADPQGQMRADLSVSGNLAEPQIAGRVQVENAAVVVPDLGLDLQDLHLVAEGGTQEPFQLEAQVRSGQGLLQLTGQAKLTLDWVADLTIKGEQVEVANIPAAWVIASPDITIRLSPQQAQVKGVVTIPQAMITPAGGSTANSAVVESDDVILVNPKTPTPETTPTQWAISSQVQVILGEQVSFEGMGLNARLQGALAVSNRPYKETIGHGELKIVEGTYKGYGQNLQIERGRVVYAGGPLTNPGLDIQAVRHIKQAGGEEDILAGLSIQGTAEAPSITLFSQPTFDQTNTLSYILLGKPVAQAAEGEGQILMNAVSSLPLEQGNAMAQKVAGQFGLDEASISSEGGIEGTALVLGKYLSPRLYISYGIGLFENSSVFRIRYYLTKRLTLQTETGTQSGADLHYTIEW